MASAAIAAPPMTRTNFQSANNSFNETPCSQITGTVSGGLAIACTQYGGKTSPLRPNPHPWDFPQSFLLWGDYPFGEGHRFRQPPKPASLCPPWASGHDGPSAASMPV